MLTRLKSLLCGRTWASPGTPGRPRASDLTGLTCWCLKALRSASSTDHILIRVCYCSSLYSFNAKVCLPLTPLTDGTRTFFPGCW